MRVALVWQAVSGAVMLIGGAFCATGLVVRHRWVRALDSEDKGLHRAAVVGFAFIGFIGALFLKLASQGYVATRGSGIHGFRW